MQEEWIHSSLLIDLLLERLQEPSVRYSNKAIMKAKAVLSEYIVNENGLLYRILRDNSTLLEDDSTRTVLVIPPGKLRSKIVSDSHNSPASGHFSSKKTYSRVKRNFFWKGMREDIRLYSIGCEVCSRTKGDIKRP